MAAWLTGRVTDKIRWNQRLYSLRIEITGQEGDQEGDQEGSDNAGFGFSPGQFVRVALDIDGERVARPYSLVNVPGAGYLEIYFNTVPQGPLSPRLAALEPGDDVFVAARANGFLVVDEIPRCEYLWMFATGTGVGPFLSILASDAVWQRFDKVILAYSVREQSELSYRELISDVEKSHAGQFVFIPVVTREQVEGAMSVRITEAIESGDMEQYAGVPLDADHSHVMMCGNSGMISSVSECLKERGMKKHLRRDPGHITTEKYH